MICLSCIFCFVMGSVHCWSGDDEMKRLSYYFTKIKICNCALGKTKAKYTENQERMWALYFELSPEDCFYVEKNGEKVLINYLKYHCIASPNWLLLKYLPLINKRVNFDENNLLKERA